MLTLKQIKRRPAWWLRRTRWVGGQILSDLGLGGPNPPVWARDNPFLFKAGLADLRRFRLGWRLAWTVGILGAIVLGAAALTQAYPQAIGTVTAGVFGIPLPFALLCLLTFVHAMLITSARQASALALSEEMRRGTLPNLLMTPLRPAEMALAMGVGPARTAALTALVGLPLYALLAQIGVLTGRDVLFLLLLFALICYAPPVFALPVRGGDTLTPDTAAGKAASLPVRRAGRGGQAGAAIWSYGFAALTISPLLGTLGGWLAHLLTALGLSLPGPMGRILVIFAWPVYGAQLLGTALPLFHARLFLLPFVLVLLVSGWVAAALETAAALSAADLAEMGRLPLLSRARTLRRWAGRLAVLLGLGVVWTAWVESGDTASLVGGSSGINGAEAAGLLLLLGGACLITVGQRAFASPALSLRRVLVRGGRPLGAAGVLFLLACALGGLSPFAPAVGLVCLELLAVGAATVVWGWSLARRVPSLSKSLFIPLLVPLLALSLPPSLSLLSVLSPVAAWVSLFPPLAALVPNLPWHPAALPPLWECVAGLAVVGAVLAGGVKTPGKVSVLRTKKESTKKPVVERHQALTARLMADVTARTDNPLFTHEMRVRTRSGGWANWRVAAPAIFAAACLLGLTYPEVIAVVSFLSPFHFFPTSFLNSGPPWANLAALTLTAECFFVAFRAPAQGEALLMRDRQRGIWGFLLLTPLSASQIFRGKLLGQSAGPLAALGVCAVAALLFSLFSAFTVGLLPALAAWSIGQGFALCLWLLGVAVGAALSSWNVFSRGLRGAAPLLFTGLCGFGLWAQFQWLPFGFGPSDWRVMATRLLVGIAEMLPVAAGLLWFAEWRIGAMRRRDIVAGDGTE